MTADSKFVTGPNLADLAERKTTFYGPIDKQPEFVIALEKLSGKKVDVTKSEDPNLLGGVVAKVGDVVYDGSLRTQLRNLRDELTK